MIKKARLYSAVECKLGTDAVPGLLEFNGFLKWAVRLLNNCYDCSSKLLRQECQIWKLTK